jgi:lipopolysaccharide/colanic/teichoic acid biosynthesis glycosyltransferase
MENASVTKPKQNPEHLTPESTYLSVRNSQPFNPDRPRLHLAEHAFTKIKPCLSIRVMDFVLSATLLLCCLPLMAAIGALIRIFEGRPVFFRQVRPGLYMNDMTVLKFRTMRVGAEHLEDEILDLVKEPNVQRENDDRVTRIGKILRRLSLDELPQLLLVLRGQMSLVGPRPLIKAEVNRLPPKYLSRYEVLPGITGLAQVSGRGKLSVWDILDLDLEWVENYSLGLYLKILFKTLMTIFKSGEAF